MADEPSGGAWDFEAGGLPEGEAPFRAIADDAGASITVKDREGRFLYANRRFAALARRPPESLLGVREAELFAPEKAAELREADRAVLETGTPSEREERLATPKGERAAIVARLPLRTRSGAIYAVCSIATDITDRRRAEAALEENREKYRGLSEAAFESIFISERGICLEQNRTAELTFGYSSAEAIGRSGIEWIAPEDRALVLQNMLAGHEEPYQVTALRKDGSTFPATSSISRASSRASARPACCSRSPPARAPARRCWWPTTSRRSDAA
jgi:PAS domain S-box-containing protein